MDYKEISVIGDIVSEISGLVYKDEAYNLIGAAMEVHSILGCGFMESVYSHALSTEFDMRKIPYQREARICLSYKGIALEKYYVADFLCYEKILLEIKATSEHRPEHEAQVLNYLKATNLKLGIILNFGMKSLHYKRIVL